MPTSHANEPNIGLRWPRIMSGGLVDLIVIKSGNWESGSSRRRCCSLNCVMSSDAVYSSLDELQRWWTPLVRLSSTSATLEPHSVCLLTTQAFSVAANCGKNERSSKNTVCARDDSTRWPTECLSVRNWYSAHWAHKINTMAISHDVFIRCECVKDNTPG